MDGLGRHKRHSSGRWNRDGRRLLLNRAVTEQRRCFIHVRGPPHGTNQVKGSEGCIIGPCNKLSDDATLTHTAEDAVQTKDALLRTAVLYAAAEATHGTCCQYSHLTSGGEEWKERHSVSDDCGGAVKVEVGGRRHHRLILQGTRIIFSLSSSIISLLLLFRPLVCPPTTALLPLHNRVVIHPGPIAPLFIYPRSNHNPFVAFHSSD